MILSFTASVLLMILLWVKTSRDWLTFQSIQHIFVMLLMVRANTHAKSFRKDRWKIKWVVRTTDKKVLLKPPKCKCKYMQWFETTYWLEGWSSHLSLWISSPLWSPGFHSCLSSCNCEGPERAELIFLLQELFSHQPERWSGQNLINMRRVLLFISC